MAPIEFELTSKNVGQLTNDELIVAIKEAQKRSLLDNLDSSDKTEKTESKEVVKKSLEFEKDTFKIDSTGWKEEEKNVKGGTKIKVKVSPTGDVVEYSEGPVKGEQIFITYDAFIREVCKAKNCSPKEVESKYLMNAEEFKETIGNNGTNSEEYKKFFNEKIKNHLAGSWNSDEKEFSHIGEYSNIWLSGGWVAGFSESGYDYDDYHRNYGFSGRLLKN